MAKKKVTTKKVAKKKAGRKRSKPSARKKTGRQTKKATRKTAKKKAKKPAAKSRQKAVPRELAKIRKSLLERRAAILKGLDQEYLQKRDRGEGRFADVSDMATEIADGEMALQVAQEQSVEIAQINEALAKIDDRTYGSCESCGRKIPAARLEVLPYATLCVRCKEAEERGRGSADVDGILGEIEFGEEAEEE